MENKTQPSAAADQLVRALKPVTSCHVCGSTDPADRHRLGNRGIATHDAFQGDRSAPWARADLVGAVRCRRCGLIYVDPMPLLAEVDMDALYHTAYFTAEPAAAVEPDLARMDTLLQRAGITPGSEVSYLEVGFGRGAVLMAAQERGVKATGVEISRELLEAFRERSAIPVHHGALPELGLPAASFDLIYLSQVIEHLTDPRAYLKAIFRLLKPGGKLYLSLPNEGSLFFKLASRYKRWRDGSTYHLSPLYPPYHLYGFTRKSLTTLLGQEGLHVVFYDAHMEAVSSGTSGLRRGIETLIFKLERLTNQGYCMDLVARKPQSESAA